MLIRSAVITDCPAILDIYNYYVRGDTCTYQEKPDTIEERERWFREHDSQHPAIVAEINGQVVGWAALSPYHPRSAYRYTVENSIYIDQAQRGKGIGKLLLAELILRAKTIGHHTIIAIVSADQPASIKLHEKFGFIPVGQLKQVGHKFSRWLDVVHLQLMLK